ncbi:hypothetical protein ACFMB7_28315 [Bacillus toyonensis]
MLNNVVYYDKECKDFFLEDLDSKVDAGIRNVVNAINEIDNFVTMNSCQGRRTPDTDTEHCPITYVDFYALECKFLLAEALFIFLKREFGDDIDCRLDFEEECYIDENDYAVPTGEVSYRYRIESMLGNDAELLQRLADKIREFKTAVA